MEKKCVLITGSNKGLGKELALVFARNNYNIILHGRNKKDLEEVEEQVSKLGVKCFSICGDLRFDKTIKDLSKIAIKKSISVLINNAGLHCPYLPLEKIKDDQINDIIITNLVSPIKLTKKIYKLFLKKGHRTIININSLSGLKISELRSIYSASKWGLRGFSETFKIEAKKHKVRVLDVYPGRIKTKPQFKFGMEPENAAQKIYDAYKNTGIDQIQLDGREGNE